MKTCTAVFVVSSVKMSPSFLSQVVGAGSIRSSLSVRADVVLWLAFLKRLLHCDGLPLHHLQHSARDVHLHLPLSPPEEGEIGVIFLQASHFISCYI